MWPALAPGPKFGVSSAGHHQPALAAVIGEAARPQQVPSDQDACTRGDDVYANDIDGPPLWRIRRCDGTEGRRD